MMPVRVPVSGCPHRIGSAVTAAYLGRPPPRETRLSNRIAPGWAGENPGCRFLDRVRWKPV
jgi:hypothetical protein